MDHSGASWLVRQDNTADCAVDEQNKLLSPREGSAAAHIALAMVAPSLPSQVQVDLTLCKTFSPLLGPWQGTLLGPTAGQYSLGDFTHTDDIWHVSLAQNLTRLLTSVLIHIRHLNLTLNYRSIISIQISASFSWLSEPHWSTVDLSDFQCPSHPAWEIDISYIYSLLAIHDLGTGPDCNGRGAPSCSVLSHSFWSISVLAKVQPHHHPTKNYRACDLASGPSGSNSSPLGSASYTTPHFPVWL